MTIKQVFYGIAGRSIRVGSDIYSSGIGPMVIGSGKAVVQPRALHGVFDALESTGMANIEVIRADHSKLEVHGEDNLVDFLETDLIGSSLHVGIKRGVNYTSKLPLKVIAWTPSVLEVNLSGSGDAFLVGLDQATLKVELTGSGDFVADGRVTSVALALHGSGSIDTQRLQANKAIIKLHGSGDVQAFAKEEATVRHHGSGDVCVKGNPRIRDAKVSGSGDIEFDE